jgi:hypothetical protein
MYLKVRNEKKEDNRKKRRNEFFLKSIKLKWNNREKGLFTPKKGACKVLSDGANI